MCVPGAQGGQKKKAMDSLELGLEVVVSRLSWVLGSELGSSGSERADSEALLC